ncbi:hypothetical protein D3C84_1118290 [compost metagenome]
MQAGGLAAGREGAHQLGTVGGVDGFQALAEFAGVRAVAGEQAGRTDNADAGLAVVQFFAGALTDGLQAVEIDVHR